jgi:vacuolar protein sorting-associated protein 45
MKALILDPMTTQIVSAVYSQTQILEQEVYLVELLGKRHEPMMHLKAAVFIQPTEANLSLLSKELKDPKFAEYHIFFSNIVPGDILTKVYSPLKFKTI